MSTDPMPSPPPLAIVYDGDCPLCKTYLRMLRLRALGEVELIDARQDHPLVERLMASGVDLDEGMAVEIGDQRYLGDQAIHRLALMTSPSTTFNRLNHWILRSRTRSRLLYPILRTGRRILLFLLKRQSIAGNKSLGVR